MTTSIESQNRRSSTPITYRAVFMPTPYPVRQTRD